MKVEIEVFVTYEKPWRKGDHGFSVQGFDPTPYGADRAMVMKQMVEFEVPDDFDPRPQLVKPLEIQKQKALEAFAATVDRIDRQINELLALEYTA